MMLQQGAPPGIINNNSSGNSPSQPHDTVASSTARGGAGAELAGSGGSGFSEDERGRIDDGGCNSGGNRWPRQETLALLKIRSDMDIAFRDSSLKGPLWDEVSRKLAELGFHRSAKKCKEKFENVYKYHKRTKEGRTSKADGKTYRFFDQLQALEGSPAVISHHQPPPPEPQQPSVVQKPPQVSPMPNTQIPSVVMPANVTVSHQNNVDPISVAAPAVTMPTMNINHVAGYPFSQLNLSVSTNSDSSSSSSDDEPPERRKNRKRKWKEFFGKLMKELIDKQEELQSKFRDSLERRERDRMAREEVWRMQEIAKMKREHELLVQERSMVAAKDAAVISFLQKIMDQNPNTVIPQMPAMQLLQQQQQQQHPPPQPIPSMESQQQQLQQATPPLAVPVPLPVSVPAPVSVSVPIPVSVSVSIPVPAPPPPAVKSLDNGGENMLQPSPSRWPKAEINALVRLRTTLDTKYQESGPKGPLWEEISSAMRKLGYNRNAKRCKEKWENINKYYKKVKESSKKRPEDSKTCPYFHQLDAIYREKAGSSSNNNNNNTGFGVKAETQMAPIMARPEQQWPLPLPGGVQEPHQYPYHQLQQQQQQQQQHRDEHQQQQTQQPKTNEPTGNNEHQQNDDEDEYDDDEDEDDDEEEGGGDYEVVPNKTSSMATVE